MSDRIRRRGTCSRLDGGCGKRKRSAYQQTFCLECRGKTDAGIIGIITQDVEAQSAIRTEIKRRVAKDPNGLVSFGELFDMAEKAERGEALYDKQAADKAYWLNVLNGKANG